MVFSLIGIDTKKEQDNTAQRHDSMNTSGVEGSGLG